MQTGIWRLRVVNGNDLHLRRQPIIEENDGKPALWETDDSFQKDRIVVCDRRIAIGSHAHSHTLATNPQSQNERTDSCPPSSAESPAESSRDDGCSFYHGVLAVSCSLNNGLHNFIVLFVHLSSKEQDNPKEYKGLLTIIDAVKKCAPVVIMGDFNASLYSGRDRLKRFCTENDLADSMATHTQPRHRVYK